MQRWTKVGYKVFLILLLRVSTTEPEILGHTLGHVILLGQSDFSRTDTNVHLFQNLLEGAESVDSNEVEKRIFNMDFDSGKLFSYFRLC